MEKSIRQHRRNRSIWFWSKNAEKIFSLFFLFLIMYSLLFICLNGFDGKNYSSKLYFTIQIWGVAVSFIMPFSAGNDWMHISLAFGSGRKETYLGMLFMSVLQYVQIMVFCVLGILLVYHAGIKDQSLKMSDIIYGPETFCLTIGLSSAALILALALGQIGSIISQRGGKAIEMLYVMTIVICVAALMLRYIFLKGSVPFLDILYRHQMFWTVITNLGAALIFAGSSWLMYRMVKKCEVKGL